MPKSPSVLLPENRTPLPPGYSYADSDAITLGEKADLHKQVDSKATKLALGLSIMFRRFSGTQIIDIGVCDEGGQLVGFSNLFIASNSGELGNLIVSPESQGEGIGKVLIDERLKIAEQAGIDSLYIPGLSDANTLESYYLGRGFSKTEFGELIRGPLPAPVPGTRSRWKPGV